MRLPVDRSITVSAPHRVAQRSFATSSSTVDVTAEVPMLAFTLTRNRLPIIIGSDSGWLTLTGSTARPAASSSTTTDTGTPSRMATYSISGVTTPARARLNWVPVRPDSHGCRVFGRPSTVDTSGPDVSYNRTGGVSPAPGTPPNCTPGCGPQPPPWTLIRPPPPPNSPGAPGPPPGSPSP